MFINSLRILHLHTMYFDYICPILPDTYPKTPPNFTPFFKKIMHCIQFVVPLYSWVWAIHCSIVDLPGVTSLMKIGSPSSSSHQLSKTLQLAVGGLVSPYLLHAGWVILCRSSADSHSTVSSRVQVVLVCPEDIVSPGSFLTLSS